ncbi:3-mercaptopyruvate sulfurtransferase [Aurantimonas endophytica]|uniref:Sulfurtransferase n=1 Tax=Aurantimonas endophytica TaxID=1522175 RepID=A0A7W6H9Y6_9HYPH|nr:3-mercaptopyruvate sulfurtransferase [Aurantimonas endophytica]MBB4001283.1 thiosulfate/3-mercaptopyruvate sulfurtransferase [Aurantimonas endophytica]MCO6403073.1 3-mercaptopyruvate sulfurtransferase [Aurantimonas endophytica]
MTQNPFLISPERLAETLGRPGIAVVDASWYLPAQNRFARAEYDAAHIPGAVFFDQDAVVDPASSQPHALPTETVFADAAGRMGISDTDTIVVYDGMGLFSAPRVWWLFRVFGAKDVRLLDGGFPAWQAAGLPVETEVPSPAPAQFNARLDRDAVASLDEMQTWVSNGGRQIADARPADRFAGEAPEPRAGVRAGHMPGAASVPIGLVTEGGRLKSPEALRDTFAAAGVDPDAPVVTSCGSGVTAAVLNLALASLGNADVKLYDGSWTEWGSAADTPVETGR